MRFLKLGEKLRGAWNPLMSNSIDSYLHLFNILNEYAGGYLLSFVWKRKPFCQRNKEVWERLRMEGFCITAEEGIAYSDGESNLEYEQE